MIALHLAEVAVATLPALGTTPAQLAAFQRWLEADSLLLGDVPCWTKKPMLNGKVRAQPPCIHTPVRHTYTHTRLLYRTWARCSHSKGLVWGF